MRLGSGRKTFAHPEAGSPDGFLNREGLLSLARQLQMLAEEPEGSHIHYDEYSCLEEGSADLIIEKKD